MKLHQFLIFFLLIPFMQHAQNQPKAEKKEHFLTKHGHQRNDSYFWMNQRDSKEVLDYIAQENNFSKAYFENSSQLQAKLLQEFESRINPNEVFPPFKIHGLEFQIKHVENKDYSVLYVKEKDKQVVFFDENQRAEGKEFYDRSALYLSPNNNYLAISEDFIGRRKYTISIRNEKTKKFIKDKINDTDGSLVWANDNKTIFYVKKDLQTLREYQVYKHVIGTESSEDKLIYEEKDEKFAVYISKTQSEKYVLIHSESTSTNEILYFDAAEPNDTPKIVIPRKKGHLYEFSDHDNGYYILSNQDAPNKKVMFLKDLKNVNDLKEIIPHNSKKLIEEMIVLKTHIILTTRENGLEQIDLIDLQNNKIEKINMNEDSYSLTLNNIYEYNPESILYTYNSLTTPYTEYRYNLKTKKTEISFQRKLLDQTFKPENYTTKRVWATANDGTKIPISIVYKNGTVLKNAPLLLYGYGSYGVTITPNFNPYNISILDRGFVFAIAHIRGGKYLGEEWYEDGKFQKKKNTFTDFINAAEHLGLHEYCDPNKIYAEGGSAGGLLMGAITNMAPYLWKGVIAQVPFVDVVTTMLDESIPLTVGEYEEWGNPNEEDFYWYMLSYSPYDQVKKMDYPALFISTGYHDSQVQYWEPLKWIAKIREFRTNNNPLILDCNMDAGHGGGSGRTNSRIEIAKEFSFILGLEGFK
jgi:oligopeptidase B